LRWSANAFTREDTKGHKENKDCSVYVTGLYLCVLRAVCVKGFPARTGTATAGVLGAAFTPPLMCLAVQKKNQRNKNDTKPEFALTGRVLRKYKKLYLRTINMDLVHL
jgi:hypothetical protein